MSVKYTLPAEAPQSKIDELNSKLTIKYKDYETSDGFTTNELGYVKDLSTYGISGYTPVYVVKIAPTGNNDRNLIPFVYDMVGKKHLMAYNRTGSAIAAGTTYKFRVYFVNNDIISAG